MHVCLDSFLINVLCEIVRDCFKHNDCMGLYEILPHYLQGPRDHMLGIFCYCNNCEFPDFERPHYFIEKISTSFEVEKSQR